MDDNKRGSETGSQGKSTSEIILEAAEQNSIEYFIDQHANPFIAVNVDDHVETLNMNSTRIRHWLSLLCFNIFGIIPSGESITNALGILKSKSLFGKNRKSLHLRVGNIDTNIAKIYYDLTNNNWEFIEITSGGWKIVKRITMLLRYSNQIPQVYPSQKYRSDIFERFMNLLNLKDEQNKLILKCYIISLFIPDIPKPILMLYGEQGSAKSTLQELIKMLIDPSMMRTQTFPRDINELVQKLSHNYIAYFDNVSAIKEWISNELCRAVTGSGFSKTTVYGR